MKHYYTSLDDIFVYNFYQVAEKQNFAYLDREYKGYGVHSYTEKEDIEVKEIWEKLTDEHSKRVGNNEHIMYYELLSELVYLTSRKRVMGIMLEILTMTKVSDDILKIYSMELKKWGYKIDLKIPFQEQVPRLINQLKASQNKISVLESEKEELENQHNSKDKISLTKQQVKLEQALERNEIDIKTTVMSKWLDMFDEVKEINAHRKNRNGRK
ncbi:MAG: hypothetical protein AB8G11_18195 [Saprospiraceae bacterium]